MARKNITILDFVVIGHWTLGKQGIGQTGHWEQAVLGRGEDFLPSSPVSSSPHAPCPMPHAPKID
ncbi:hypothetical protein VF04_06640 [Nostoc linckia z7]|uniref:Uncharacterized protein n=1 Tax=Nostoc linckia z7 TaxID=1628745 RepID=A0ABX4KTU0_NOSLI|nr:hypothetical protein VF04_06640 [Nostoc linckia z7]